MFCVDLDLYRNTIEYIYKNRRRDAAKIILHFINIKELKYAYIQNGNRLAQAMVAYLGEEMWWLHASELCYNEAKRPI